MESGIESINENIIEEELIQEKKKVNKKLIIGLVLAGLVAVTVLTTFLVGYFKFDWFQTKQDNVIDNTYHKGQVLVFDEVKTLITEAKSPENRESLDQIIKTRFLVIVNSKKKLNYFGEIDYLYNATLVILKMDTNEKQIGGLNLLNEEEREKFKKNPKKFEVPIAKFAFYENGTLVDIYITKNSDKFSASSLVDLIEEIIPRISKKLYNKEGKNVKFSVKEYKDGKIIIETHKDKEFTDKYSKIGFKGSKVNKKITRKIVNDVVDKVTIESQLELNTEKPENDESFYDIGLDQYKVKLNSDLNLVENKDDKELIKKIELAIEEIDYEESQKLLEKLTEDEIKEIKDIAEKEEEEEETDKKELRNLGSVSKTIKITSIKILSKTIDFNYIVDFNDNGGVDYCLEAKCGGSSIKLSRNGFTASASKSGNIGPFDIVKIPFQLGPIPLKFQLSARGDYSISFNMIISSAKSEATLSGSFNAWLAGSISVGVKLAKASVVVEGRVVGLSGSVTFNIKTRGLTGDLTLYCGSIKISVEAKLLKKKYSKTLYTSNYFTKKLW